MDWHTHTHTHEHIYTQTSSHAHSWTCGPRIIPASWTETLSLGALLSVFWKRRWIFAIFRCTVKVDETLGQRLTFTFVNVLMSRLLRVETVRVSLRQSRWRHSVTFNHFFFVSSKTKNNSLLQLCVKDVAWWFWRSPALIWNTFYSFITSSSGAAGDGHRGGCSFFFFSLLKEMFLYRQQGNFLCLYSVFKNQRAFVQGKHFCVGRTSRVFTCTKMITEMKLNLLSRLEQSARPRLCTLLSSVKAWLDIFKWMWVM